ncbi:hypothetical protein AB1L07_22730, partial [Niallia alba]|uniref:hypothetical protein n=1 Tax=Niallia alba TaxID=2729105 RepID=UPI00399F1437
DFSQTLLLSANVRRISAKLCFYQPTWGGFQPNFAFISQREADFSQTLLLSANVERISAKLRVFQPTPIQYQSNSPFISPTCSLSIKRYKIKL